MLLGHGAMSPTYSAICHWPTPNPAPNPHLLCHLPLPPLVQRADQAAGGDRIALHAVGGHVAEHLQRQRPLAALGEGGYHGAVGDGVPRQARDVHALEYLQVIRASAL